MNNARSDQSGKGIHFSNPRVETEVLRAHPLISWRSTLAGLLVAFLAMAILVSLGVALGGVRLADSSAKDVGVFSGVWFLASAVIAVLIGAYLAGRVSKYHMLQIGAAQGAVIAALFFGFVLYQSASAVVATGRLVGFAAAGVAESSMVGNAIEDSLGDLNVRGDPQMVFQGVAFRLIQGDVSGAKAYLARHSSLSQAEASARIDQARAQLDQTMAQVAQQSAKAAQGAGWSVFALLLLGTIAAAVGGALGAHANVTSPLAMETEGYEGPTVLAVT